MAVAECRCLDTYKHNFAPRPAVELRALFDAVPLGAFHTLETLVFQGDEDKLDTQLAEAEIAVVADAISKVSLPSLRKLVLSGNALRDGGMTLLAKALGSGAVPLLIILDFNCCNVGERGGEALASAVRTGAMPELQKLHLDANLELGAGGAALVRARANGDAPRLRILDVGNCGLGKPPCLP